MVRPRLSHHVLQTRSSGEFVVQVWGGACDVGRRGVGVVVKGTKKECDVLTERREDDEGRS